MRAARASVALAIALLIGTGVDGAPRAALALGRENVPGTASLSPDGIGTVRFGLTKVRAVAELSDQFGAPSARGANTGCGPRYTEVEWGDLVAEFRLGRFSGYRYVKGGWRGATGGSPLQKQSPSKSRLPQLTTVGGITLGSTIAQARAAYGRLRLTGAEKWETQTGITLVVNANVGKVPPTRIYEIKVGACGDF